jgi:hypothetical protein
MAVTAVLGLGTLLAGSAEAEQRLQKTFIVVLTADAEVPPCGPATDADRGLFIGRVIDEEAGTVAWILITNDLPGNLTAAHIHNAPVGVPGLVVQPLPLIPGQERGVIGLGTFSNPELVAELRANPDQYYVNVHSNECPPGVIRGQF